MNRSLNNLRESAVSWGIVSEEKSKKLHKQTLCSLLGLPSDKPYKYRLTNLVTGIVIDWVSVYQLAKMYGINENNFFYRMKTNKPINIDGELHTISKIPEDKIIYYNNLRDSDNENENENENEVNNISDSDHDIVFKIGDTDDSYSDTDDGGKPKIVFRYEKPNDIVEYDDDGEMIGMRD